MIKNNKMEKFLGGDRSDLQQKVSKIVNQDVIDTSFSHTLGIGIKNNPTKEKLLPEDIFASNDRRKSNKKNKCNCKDAESNGKLEKK
jgi:hypothetical protein